MTFPLGFDRPEWLLFLFLAAPLLLWGLWGRPRWSWTRRALAVAVRALLFLLLALAAAGLAWRREVDAVAVIFAVDRSASVGAAGEAAATKFVTEALAAAQADDQAGVVVFGEGAMIDAAPRTGLRWGGAEATPLPHQTDLAAALRLSVAMLPADRARRVVVLSDGAETRGDVLDQLAKGAESDIEISVVPIGGQTGPEMLVEDVIAPPRVDEGSAFDLRVVVRSEVETTASLRLMKNNGLLGEVPVTLRAGRSEVFSFRQGADSPGLARFRAVIVPDDPKTDQLLQNNESVTTVQVSGRPQVLLLEGEEGDAGPLAETLRADGFEVEVRPGALIPPLADLRGYEAVFLVDVPAYAVPKRNQGSLKTVVTDLGRGLAMVGGDHSFGLGGWYATPVEEVLPVRMDLKDKATFPAMAMVIAIDKSCSMGEGEGSKLGIAKEAGILTTELLSRRDQFGLIGFDGAASWVVPLAPLEDPGAVADTIASLRSGGGTDIYPALDAAYTDLRTSGAALNHVILLSDGITQSGEYEALVSGASRDKITLTTVAIGKDSDLGTMEDLARWGGGNFYVVEDIGGIPAIFTRETLLASRAFLLEETFRVETAQPSEVLGRFDAASAPPLYGLVATEARPLATVALDMKHGETRLPVLTHWRKGLGRAAAFSSDAKGRWAKDWIGTDHYGRLWTQTSRWLVGTGNDDELTLEAEIRDGELRVTADVFDGSGQFRNYLRGEARVVGPDLVVHPLELRQVAPGRYQASLPVDRDGSWLVGVSLNEGEALVAQGVAEAVQAYSPEYRSSRDGRAVLDELGRVGRGGLLVTAADAFRRPPEPRVVPRPLWRVLLVLAALVLLADVGLRRLEFGRRRKVAPRMVVARPAFVAPAPASGAAAPSTRAAPPDEAPPVDPEAGPTEPPSATDIYASRLLKARSKARKKLDGGES